MGFVIGPLRLLGLAVLLLAGLAIALLVFPWQSQAGRNRIIGGWSRALVKVCGLRVNATGVLPPELARTGIVPGRPGRLLLANHISWIDVFALNAALPVRFVAKAEIGAWPLMGTLVTLAGTLYIERGRRHAVHAMNQRVRERLQAGESVAVFPEGTTTDGSHLLAFHSNLVAPALDLRCEIWPVALRYTQHGRPTQAAAFIGETTMLESMWRIATARGLAIEIAFLAPLTLESEPPPTRHQVAHAARAEIARHLGLPTEEPSHRATAN